ncbi:MAG: putative Ig domain-containing protein [Bacteroidota bacterium]
MKKAAITLVLFLLFGFMASSQTIPPDSLYFGQTPPGSTPRIFAPGIISVPGRVEYGISISPAGDEMLFALGNWPNKRTMIMKYENNHWTGPATVSFSTTRSAEEAIYSPGGQRVYYYAYNPPNPVGGADLCYSVKNGSVWSEPINLGTPLNTVQDEYHPCVVADSSIYFENSVGLICYSKFQNGAYTPRIILPALFNDPNQAWGNPFVAPDESYFIFNSSRPGGFGGTDLYIAYKKSDGSWTNPKNLGSKINTSTSECGSEITDDNLYMTYVSNNDIYWVGSGFIDSLKHTNFIPYVKNLIPSQTTVFNQVFIYTIPDTTFIDDDGNNTLTYSAKLLNGNPLPSWLSFDTITATFSGTPTAVEILNIKITATDTAGASASTSFKITVTDHVSIDQVKGQPEGVLIYPNPTNGLINISLSSMPNKTARAEICNLQGKVILTSTFQKDVCLDLTGCPKGICILKLFIDDETTIRKICIQ